MNNYNFSELLSPLRFEQLVRDLLTEQHGQFENFAEGKDGGIDFRCSTADGKVLIVQCKRYKSLNNLLSNLKKEKQKLLKLDFTDYVLAVSIDLTDVNKKKVLEIFDGNIKNANQILLSSDLNYLLSLNKDIEFKYPELWMKSINIHQKIFNLGFIKHSEFMLEKIKVSLKTFVPYEKYYETIEHFRHDNAVIISGNPGVGKTTLSHAVVSHFVYFENYNFIDVSYRSIQEVESYLYDDKPTIFLIDDFLGKIRLERESSYTQLLLLFIEKIQTQANKKVILNSREYIISKAKKELSSVEHIEKSVWKNVVEIKSFTRKIRTEILYNHLKNSNLPVSFIDNFLNNDFKNIIDHRNYNPRIVEHLTNARLLREIKPSEYFVFFTKNLDNPFEVWQNVYNNLPNDLYKMILILPFIISEKLSVESLEKAIIHVIDNNARFNQYGYDDFDYIMAEMEGTFFAYEDYYDEMLDENCTIINYQNPSVMDFINNFIWKKKKWLRLIIESSIYFEQLFNYRLLDEVAEDPTLLSFFRNKILTDFNKLTNACVGFFEFYTPDEHTLNSWIPERYNYFLHYLTHYINLKEDKEITDLIKREMFRYSLDEELSEKIAFSEIAIELLKHNLIESNLVLKHYLESHCQGIEDLVSLEYLTRVCSEEDLCIVRQNKTLAKKADAFFLQEIKYINNKDLVDSLDFIADYEQIKFLFPLPKTTKKLKEMDVDSIIEEAGIRTKHAYQEASNDYKKRTSEDTAYQDIDDESVTNIIKRLKE